MNKIDFLKELIKTRELDEHDAKVFSDGFNDCYNCPPDELICKVLMVYLDCGKQNTFKEAFEAIKKNWDFKYEVRAAMMLQHINKENKEDGNN